MNALANPEVGKYLNLSFVSAYQKVGTFKVAGGQKQGGNVASYFCTPDGQVLHAVAGPANAGTLLREARWAVETYKLAVLDSQDDDARMQTFFRKAHAERLRTQYGADVERAEGRLGKRALNNQGRVHLLLAAAPLAKVDQVYKLVFEKILGEKISTAPVIEGG